MNCAVCQKPFNDWISAYHEDFKPKYWAHLVWTPLDQKVQFAQHNLIPFCSPDCSLNWTTGQRKGK